MGNSNSYFNKTEIDKYKKLTYLKEPEIIRCFERFSELVKRENSSKKITVSGVKDGVAAYNAIIEMEELKRNPFKDRIAKVFSSNVNGDMSFEDFLNMMSVFCEAAPSPVKCYYAFKIYDYGDKNVLDKEDVKKLIKTLVGAENAANIKDTDMNLIIDKIFDEADIDENNEISLDEFDHIVTKSPEFASMFCIRL